VTHNRSGCGKRNKGGPRESRDYRHCPRAPRVHRGGSGSGSGRVDCGVGENFAGQCNVPTPDSGFVAFVAGGNHSLGLKADGSIVAWEVNNQSQCDVPPPNSGFTAVAAGSMHSLGLKGDSSVVAWGDNIYGQCTVPAPNSGFVAIEGGNVHSLGVKGDGSVVAWGYNSQGQCDVPNQIPSLWRWRVAATTASP